MTNFRVTINDDFSFQKFWVILVLCVAGALGDKKINLDDIEKDNLQSEAQTDAEDAQPEEAKYNSEKADDNTRFEYRTEARLLGGQQPQEYKYVVIIIEPL